MPARRTRDIAPLTPHPLPAYPRTNTKLQLGIKHETPHIPRQPLAIQHGAREAHRAHRVGEDDGVVEVRLGLALEGLA
ncbi:hypothetical protein CVT26_011822, partial [Gymnopilus dilepis]